MKKIIASKLNKSIDIYSFTTQVEEDGSQSLEYDYLISVFANVKPIEGAYLSFKYQDIKQLFTSNLYIFTIRAGIRLKSGMLIKYMQDSFEIKRVIEDDQIIKIVTNKLEELNVTSKIKPGNI